ncbi:EAL domain-containing protein [Paraburkholderia caribensis]|uniref:EAL domain-containing protein n=1 Tax=Paraburkholderia caribensis TaxID=75105 RepID=UPI0034D3805B
MTSSSSFRIAFQPIANLTKDGLRIYGYEALARDAHGHVPGELLKSHGSQVTYEFDFSCRRQAILDASILGLDTNLSLNFMPGAICDPQYGIDATVQVAIDSSFPLDRLVVEVTEREPVTDYKPIRNCIDRHRQNGVKLALDDFGTGYNGLNTLLELSPDIIKVDMKLVQKIETDHARQALMFAISNGGRRLGMQIVAEGVETSEAVEALRSVSITLMQGYLFARPGTGYLPQIPPDVANGPVKVFPA